MKSIIREKDGTETGKFLIFQKIIEMILIATVIFGFVTIFYDTLSTGSSFEEETEAPLVWK